MCERLPRIPEASPDEYELYDLTVDPLEKHNLAHSNFADDRTRKLQKKMLQILVEQLAARRLVPVSRETPGYRPPKKAED